MKILTCWPPHVPSYFNAGHHLPVFSIAAFLRDRGHQADALDAGALNYSWKEFGSRVFQGGYQLVILVNEFDVVEGLRRAADYVRALLPGATIMTVGRLSYQNPDFFHQFALDAVAEGGDYEAAAQEVVRWIAGGKCDSAELAGVAIRTAAGWKKPALPRIYLDASQWVFPDIRDIPYQHYDILYGDDRNKFCGIPQRRELVVPVARGCPIGCDFCDVPSMQGLRERRVSVERVIDYIRSCFAAESFEYVSFYAPTFTLNRRWVVQLCLSLVEEGLGHPWKCATTIYHLDESLVEQMAAARCVRISVGVETLEHDAAEQLPLAKQSPRVRFDLVAGWCRKFGIELNCFVIVGLPGTSVAGTRETILAIKAAGARPRPTLYTPYHRMHAGMTEREVSAFNRHLFVDSTGWQDDEVHDFLDLVFGDDSYITSATAQIPRAAQRTAGNYA